jgi:formylglycine-generating enzyme required for sulfatase activity
LGIHDMSGNVWEWCADDWHGDYKDAPTDGSAWVDSPQRGSGRVLRGGSWLGKAVHCRVSLRNYYKPDYRSINFGFRVVLFP